MSIKEVVVFTLLSVVGGTLLILSLPSRETAAAEKAPKDRPATVIVYDYHGQIVKEWDKVNVTYDDGIQTRLHLPSGDDITIKGGIIITVLH